MAGAGPASSLVIGAACFELSRVMQTPSIVHALLFYLGYVNIFLAIFNMLPGFPLDGSRVLRAVIWALTHDPVKATRWAAGTGSVVGVLMIGAGALVALRAHDPFGGLWLAFLGFIVLQSSRAAFQQSRAESRLAGVPVRDLMSPPATWIPGDITLRKAANDYFVALNARCLPVQDDHGTLEGLICVSDLQRTDPQSWGVEQVQDVMTTVDRLQTGEPRRARGAGLPSPGDDRREPARRARGRLPCRPRRPGQRGALPAGRRAHRYAGDPERRGALTAPRWCRPASVANRRYGSLTTTTAMSSSDVPPA